MDGGCKFFSISDYLCAYKSFCVRESGRILDCICRFSGNIPRLECPTYLDAAKVEAKNSAKKENSMSGNNGASLAEKKKALESENRGKIKAQIVISVFENNEIEVGGLQDESPIIVNPILFQNLIGRALTIVADEWLNRQVDAVNEARDEKMAEAVEESRIVKV